MSENFKQTWKEIVARAWKDEAFKQRLLSDPKTVLQEMGVKPPAEMKIRIHEDSDAAVNLVLPRNPASTSLSAEELDQIAGGLIDGPWTALGPGCA